MDHTSDYDTLRAIIVARTEELWHKVDSLNDSHAELSAKVDALARRLDERDHE